jgi:hypothetical protein
LLLRAGFAHAVVILDRASWHRSQGLVVPGCKRRSKNPSVKRPGSPVAPE